MKVSVIIPVYNAEKYLIECIESLLNQTLKKCEFIFVNDGSTDLSSTIIEEFKKKDSRVILINQENQGVSMARNNGLKIASGEYIGFVDADDFVERDIYETMYSHVNQEGCDAVITNIESEMDGRKFILSYPFPQNKILTRDYINQELFPYFLKADNLNSVVNKLYKSSIIKENKLTFPEGIALGEDGLFNIRFFSHATRFKYIPYSYYHYREVLGSATRSITNKDYFQRALEVYHMDIPEINKAINDKQIINKLKSIKLIHSVLAFIHIYLTPYDELSFKERYRYVRKMIRNKDVRKALPIYEEENGNGGRYEKFILKMIKQEFIFGLYLATAYSRYRNK
jgi:glycosyltransferase involved in cell wall biosynthesis